MKKDYKTILQESKRLGIRTEDMEAKIEFYKTIDKH